MVNSTVAPTSLAPPHNGSSAHVATTPTPTNSVVTSALPDNITSPVNKNSSEIQPLIFLQTQAAQGIAGTFAIAAIFITCHQVSQKIAFRLANVVVLLNIRICICQRQLTFYKWCYRVR